MSSVINQDDVKAMLADIVTRLEAMCRDIFDINNQQRAHHIAIQCFEQAGREQPPPFGGHNGKDGGFGNGGNDGCHDCARMPISLIDGVAMLAKVLDPSQLGMNDIRAEFDDLAVTSYESKALA
ncbi:hypothetical protein E2562_039022 [Oryza meyeriana var. granulata]|uniref:Uncharacterized protein n=1 Tax=Oryza meyeriana var. granulata TaxID=110450 RepID=A0A6G1DTK7_9ORYZ|nr:hypothetical protein E2562_039022 [Oryza meyeriana var. granulata]